MFSSKSGYRETGRKSDKQNYNNKNHLGISSAACPLQRRYTSGFEHSHGVFSDGYTKVDPVQKRRTDL